VLTPLRLSPLGWVVARTSLWSFTAALLLSGAPMGGSVTPALVAAAVASSRSMRLPSRRVSFLPPPVLIPKATWFGI
jgi:hypothetical protein